MNIMTVNKYSNQTHFPLHNSTLNEENTINYLVTKLGKNTQMPTYNRNWTNFNFPLVDKLVSYREKSVPAVLNVLKTAQDERTISEGLYVIDRLIENKVGGLQNAYPVISRFNGTISPTIQVLLSGIYRKTQPPDAFGPLCKMLFRDAMLPNNPLFDPSEEIGGAILDYLKNDSAKKLYPNVFKTN